MMQSDATGPPRGFCSICKMAESRTELRIGVLAIQGTFFEHRAALLKALNNSPFHKDVHLEVNDIREPEQLSGLHGFARRGEHDYESIPSIEQFPRCFERMGSGKRDT